MTQPIPLLLAALAAVGTVDIALTWLPPPTGWNAVPDGLLDEIAHLATAAIALTALFRGANRVIVRTALLASVLIDVDHVPLQLFGTDVLNHGSSRPYSHSLITIVAALAFASLLRSSRRQIALGVALGVGLHLVRDVATAGGVMLLWPLTTASLRAPYAVYAAALVALVAVAVSAPRRGSAWPGRSAAYVGAVVAGVALIPAGLLPQLGEAGRTPVSASRGWNSGVYPGGAIDERAAEAFSRFRSRHLDNVHVFLEASSWRTIGYETWEVEQYASFPRRLVIDVPLLPRSGGGTLADVAAGADDRYFRAMGRRLVAQGRPNAVLVLGSEFNGDWESYSAFHPPTFVAAFRHVARLLKSISRDFQIDWTGNAIDNQAGHDPFTEDYPGDDVVDLVGVDAYDTYDSHVRDRGFAQWANQRYGIRHWARFAHAHHKPFSIPEWGLTARNGDDPAFIRGMFGFFRNHARQLAFEDYFNEPGGTVQNSLLTRPALKASAQQYRSLWSRLAANPFRAKLRVRAQRLRHRGLRLRVRLQIPGASARHRVIRLFRSRGPHHGWSPVARRVTGRHGTVRFAIRPAPARYFVLLGSSGRRFAASRHVSVRRR